MDLRQKILFASQEAESNLKYDPVLVRSMFMHSILTGLQNDNIKSDLQTYLLQPTTSDELLLERLNIACGHEKERQNKRRQTPPQKPAGMHMVQSSDSNGDRTQTAQQQTVTLPPDCHNEDGRIQLRKESLLQEVIHSEKLNGAFRRAEAELP